MNRMAKSTNKTYGIRLQQHSGAWAGVEYDLSLREAKQKAMARAKQGYIAAVFQGNRKIWQAN